LPVFHPIPCLLWVINGHVGLHEKASALPLKADMLGAAEIVSYVPLTDIADWLPASPYMTVM
jgi:hypothetical protein